MPKKQPFSNARVFALAGEIIFRKSPDRPDRPTKLEQAFNLGVHQLARRIAEEWPDPPTSAGFSEAEVEELR